MPPSSNDHFDVSKSNLNNNNIPNKSDFNMVLQTFDNYATNNLSGGRISSVLSEIMTPYAGDYPSSLSSSYYMDNDSQFAYNQGKF